MVPCVIFLETCDLTFPLDVTILVQLVKQVVKKTNQLWRTTIQVIVTAPGEGLVHLVAGKR